MSDQTQKPKRQALSNSQFFQVCNELLNRREEVTSTCHTLAQVAAYLAERTKLNVTESAARTALKSTGVELTPVKRERTKERTHHLRVIGNALLKLYNQLGATPPQGLIDTMEVLMGREIDQKGEPDAPPAPQAPVPPPTVEKIPFAVPVKSVPKPHTISVIGGVK